MKKRTSPNGKRTTKVFNVRLDEYVLDQLRVQAEEERRTVTNLIQIIVADGIERRVSNWSK